MAVSDSATPSDPSSADLSYLWLTRWPPYGSRRGGDMDYSRYLLESLSHSTPVHVLAFGKHSDMPPEAPGLRWTLVDHDEPSRLASVLSHLPNVAYRHKSSAYLQAAITASRGVDAIFVDFIGLFGLVAPLREALGDNGPLIIPVNHNFEHDVRRQMVLAERSPGMRAALTYDTWKAGNLERAANRIADGLVANTDADARAFARVTTKPSVTISPAYNGPRLAARVIDAQTPRRICVLGNHEAHHKRMVLDQTLTALAAHGIERTCDVDVVGAGDNSEFQARFPGFNFYGYVDDIEAYLQTVRFGLIPDEIGGGFKVRALTHVFQRLPMLAVRHAVQGMGLTANIHYAEAENLDEMSTAIPELLNDFARLNRLQNAAYDHCDNIYDWENRGRSLDLFVRTLLADRA